MAATSPRLRTFVLVAGLFAFIWGARLAVIDRFGSDLPNMDQWDAEGAKLFLPFLQHRLRVADFFAPHNEHRIAGTRALALLLLWLDGQWDARLECVVNAALHAALGVAVFFHLRTLVAGWRRIALLALVAGFFAAPMSWNNVVAGFHTQQTLLLGFSFATFALLFGARAASTRWWCGLGCAALALFSMGSGLLAAATVIAVLAVTTRPRRTLWQRHGGTLVACALIVVAGLASQAPVADHAALRAQSTGDFVATFWRALHWPAKFFPVPEIFVFLPLLAWLPWAWLARRVVRTRDDGAKPRDPREITIAAAGLWVLLQFAATAYARGAGGPWPASRYTDTIAIGVGVNVVTLLVLSARGAMEKARARLLGRVAIVGCALAVLGLASHVAVNLTSDLPAERHAMRARERTVREYLRSGDRARLARAEIPYPEADALAERLDHEEIRAILPVSVNTTGFAAPLSRACVWIASQGFAILAVGTLMILIPAARFEIREKERTEANAS